ncbi:MAG: hypothetical protein A3K05_00165 [Candidatus Doudnabacteria bacterium RIFCSPHIGHO2_01_48_18]|nr:MAG: hypothetical protein A3K05_00165 [Candidatus Doudnabacteria bacterium RIFCSPHIGHO2_01_48_18]
MNFKMVLLYLLAVGKTLEWTIASGRTFQISGDHRLAAYWERFFPPKSGMPHPTRRHLLAEEAEEAFLAGTEFTLYESNFDQGEKLTRQELFAKINGLFPGFAKGGE